MSTSGAARLSVLGAALLFSTGGVAIKGTAMTSFQVAGFRSGVAALAIALLLPAARRGFGCTLVPAALAYAATLVCFVAATKLTTSASAIFLQSTAPIWVLVLAPVLLREPARRVDLPYIATAAAGLLLVFLGSRSPVATAPMPGWAALALAAGLFYALLMILMRRLARAGDDSDRSLTAMVLGNAIAFLACLPFCFPLAGVSARDVASILYLGVVQIGMAYWLLARGLRVLSALEISLLVLLEPVLNPLWTWILQGEEPSTLALLGCGVMVAALAARTLFDHGAREPALPPPPD
jgi:drug/metabolite transporter (DMT)-like permease